MPWFNVKCCGMYVFSIYDCDKQHPKTKPPALSIDSAGHLREPDRLVCQSSMEIPLKTSLFDVNWITAVSLERINVVFL